MLRELRLSHGRLLTHKERAMAQAKSAESQLMSRLHVRKELCFRGKLRGDFAGFNWTYERPQSAHFLGVALAVHIYHATLGINFCSRDGGEHQVSRVMVWQI